MLDTLVRIQLVVPISNRPPEQYAIFNAVPGRSTIFTYNLDGLAPAYCRPRHIVLQPHGSVERELFEDEAYMALLHELMEFDLGAGHLRPKILLEPEPESVIKTRAYRTAEHLFINAPVVVVVGYSFARFGDKHDDGASLFYFGELLRRSPKPVLVVDPFPDEVADMLSCAAGRQLAETISVRWDHFSMAVLDSLRRSGWGWINHKSVRAQEVLALCRALADHDYRFLGE